MTIASMAVLGIEGPGKVESDVNSEWRGV
jgi:hypothetical protein